MDEKVALIFIGSVRKPECSIKGKPSFSDAMRLSNQLYVQTPSRTYQHMPLDDTHSSFQISDSDIQLTFDRDRNTIKIIAESKQLMDEEVFNVLKHFAFKKGRKVTFLTTISYHKNRIRKKSKELVLTTERKLEDE